MSDAAQPEGPPASRRTVGAGATVATASQLVTAAALGVTGIVVARVLGAGDTGNFNVVLSALVLLAVPSTLGIELGLSYRVSGERWAPGEALRQVQLAACVLGIAGGGIGVGLALAGDGTAFNHIPLATVLIALAALPFVLSWTYSSYLALAVDRYEAYGLTPASQALLALVLVAALSPPFGLTGAVVGLAASHVITSAGVLVWGLRAIPKPPPGWLARARRELRAAAGFGIKANLNNALQQLNYRADLFLLNAVAASATVGHYAVALTVTTFALLMPRALSSVVLPRVSALDATATPEEQERMIVKSVRHAVLLVAGASALLAAGLLLVPAIYGPGFEPAIEYGYILIPGVALFGVGAVLAAIVVGKGHPRYSLYNAFIVTPPTLALYALLVPPWKGSGAALASTISYAASGVLWYVFFRRATGVRSPAVLVPGRSELGDYRALASRARARLGRRASSRASTSA